MTILRLTVALLFSILTSVSPVRAEARIVFSGEKRLNNLVAELLEVTDAV